jgi:phage/plasmid-like protein (TIGR03299 family)
MTADIEMLGTQGQMTFAKSHGNPWHIQATNAIGLDLADLDFGEQIQAVINACPTQGSSYSKLPVFVADGSAVPSAFAVRRDFDGKILPGTVGDQQTLRQPERIFGRLQDMVRAIPGATISASGFLRDGARFWVAVRVGTSTPAGEEHVRYLTFVTGFDGSLSTQVLLTTVRSVCSNTVAMAMGNSAAKGTRIKVKNTRNAEEHLDEAQALAQGWLKQYEQVDAKIEEMAVAKIPEKQAIALLFRALGVKTGDPDDASKQTRNKAREIWRLYAGKGKGSEPWNGTAWGLWNAITEYWDHHSTVKGARSKTSKGISSAIDAQKLLDSLWLGSIAKHKCQAMEIVDEYLASVRDRQQVSVDDALEATFN